MYLLYYIVLDFLNANNYPIFDSVLEESKTYLQLGFFCLILPIIYWIIFYKVYNNPYARLIHYLTAFAISLVLVGFLSYTTVNEALWGSSNPDLNQLLSSDQTAIEIGDALPLYISIYNILLAAAIGFGYSLILKRFSKIQMHLPF